MSGTNTMTQSLGKQQNIMQRAISPRPASNETAINERFPSFDDNASPSPHLPVLSESPDLASPKPEYRWPSRRGSQRFRDIKTPFVRGHRAKRSSVSEAFNNIRNRRGSVSENAHELAEALKAPVSYKLITLCITWYMTSALTNTSSKSILNALNRPVTLTIAQFASVGVWCLIVCTIAEIFPKVKVVIPALKDGLKKPSYKVFATALPLSIFQLLGHLLSSYATSKIPVSLVHTIKGLSPLFTVVAYRVAFRIRYARATYMSLVPLTVGVMLACSTDFSTNFWGIGASLGAAIVFVSQNIFSKKLFNESARAEVEGSPKDDGKLDKLNLLCYCSVGALIFSAPVWLYSEGFGILQDIWENGEVNLSERKGTLDHKQLVVEFLFNGIFHFLQNIMAFTILSLLSPVSYSVASLIKRVWVIVIAVIWFRSSTTRIQIVGIGLTMFGLYLYDRTSADDVAERRAKADHFHPKTALLPVAESPDRPQLKGASNLPVFYGDKPFEMNVNEVIKESTAEKSGEPHFNNGWLAPGTKQESTWLASDTQSKP